MPENPKALIIFIFFILFFLIPPNAITDFFVFIEIKLNFMIPRQLL